VYATACRKDVLYEVRLVKKMSGQSLAPIDSITSVPQDIYFDVQHPPLARPTPPAPSSSNVVTDSTSTPFKETIAPTTATSEIIGAVTSIMPAKSPTLRTKTPNTPSLLKLLAVIAAIAAVCALVVGALVFFVVRLRLRTRSRCREHEYSRGECKYSVEERGSRELRERDMHRFSNSRTMAVSPSFSTSGYDGSTPSIYTTPVPETGSV
jgi:hypothetical protein